MAGKTIWAFDLGKGSIGEAVRCGDKFLHKASLLIPAEFAKIKMGLTACAEPVWKSSFHLSAKRLGSSQPLTPPDWF